MNTASKVRITSPVKTDDVIFSHIEKAADKLSAIGVKVEVLARGKKTIKDFFRISDVPLIVISHQLPQVYFDSESKIVYHENTTCFKMKAFERRGELPPLIDMMQVNINDRHTIVDTTMGMGNDLVLMATVLRNSYFHAFETHPLVYFVISEGIVQHHPELKGRIIFHYGSADSERLKSADIVYADPMFEETIAQQSGMAVLHRIVPSDHNEDFVRYLLKYSRCLILKAHFRSPLFDRFGFEVQVRRSTKSHFGIKKSRRSDLFCDHHTDHIS
ncbi:class I SAM-dependent methyltransferase [Macrococcus brunensis]|uniref:class I SAM-dependent methyltransferase n=1 Tax=Macrococcus brunensis TaxID=198483 RepID=UPI001EEFBDDA|nr:class I SAM-dependent methyltransferase [Macrococcus brunensis]ULG70984.1 class I SAM-dependent methyltransferase [Macrococcus brunensis]